MSKAFSSCCASARMRKPTCLRRRLSASSRCMRDLADFFWALSFSLTNRACAFASHICASSIFTFEAMAQNAAGGKCTVQLSQRGAHGYVDCYPWAVCGDAWWGLRGGDSSFLLLSMFASRACLQLLSTGTLDRGASK